jgi:hypothetical protein
VIHHVQLACPPGSEPALREFYGNVLGLDEIPPGPLVLARAGRGVWLLPVDPESERGRVWAWPRLFSGGSPMASW